MLQDIAPKVFHNQFQESRPESGARVLLYDGDTALLKIDTDGYLHFPLADDFAGADADFTYLFSIDDKSYYLADVRDGFLPEGYSFSPLESFRKYGPKSRAYAGVTGHSLYEWYQSHIYCGRCGTPMEKDHKERMMKCPSCGLMDYPRINPAVIVAVTNGDKLLMSKYAGRLYTRFALLAGFAEIGETIEETVHREVMEEVGIRVKNLRFYKSQPWPFSNSLLFGFFCDLDGDDDTLTVDKNELSEAGWYTADEVPEDDEFSLTREMMQQFKKGSYPK